MKKGTVVLLLIIFVMLLGGCDSKTKIPNLKGSKDNKEAQEVYKCILDHFKEWNSDKNVTGATLIDLDQDGSPEFLVSKNEYSSIKVDIYTFSKDKFNQLSTFYNANQDVLCNISKLLLYHDVSGKLCWYCSNPSKGDLLEYKDGKLGIYTKFFYKANGPSFDNAIFYIDGKEYTGSSTSWYEQKQQFENALNEGTYELVPNDKWVNYDSDDNKYTKVSEKQIYKDIAYLVDAYYLDDFDYLMDTEFDDMEPGYKKPVIYLYPEKETEVNVKVKLNGTFTCTYPEYNGGWNVIAEPDGTLINKADGKEYSYLYWEGITNYKWNMSEGFVVKGSDTAAFLQEKLKYLGLTEKEYNEFIVFWLPQMQKNAYNLITFQTKDYEENVKLNITPKPDSILRVFMTYKALDEPISISEQNLSKFNRIGFAVVEWGGTEVE